MKLVSLSDNFYLALPKRSFESEVFKISHICFIVFHCDMSRAIYTRRL